MTTSNTKPQPIYGRPRSLSAIQTVLWLVAGIAGMFALVSMIFAIKLGLEGRLPFSAAPQPAAQTPTSTAPTPPIKATDTPEIRGAQATAPSANFVSGAENILPAEVAHLAKHASALDTPSQGADAPPTPPIPSTTATTPAPAASATLAPAAPATAAPTTPPAPSGPTAPAASSTASDAVQTTLNAWAKAWASKDVTAYLAHYASNFQPTGDVGRDAWAEQRRQRLTRPGNILIRLDAIDIRVDGDKASARFIQHYSAGSLKLSEPKTLELARSGNAWQIVQERIGH